MLLDPFPCHKLSHLLGPSATSSVTYFMDGPIERLLVASAGTIKISSYIILLGLVPLLTVRAPPGKKISTRSFALARPGVAPPRFEPGNPLNRPIQTTRRHVGRGTW